MATMIDRTASRRFVFIGSVLLAGLWFVPGPGPVTAADALPDTLSPRYVPVVPLGETIVARPGAAAVLDLAACLALASVHNDSLRAERERRRELDGQKYQALSTGLPTLDLIGDWTRRRDPTFALDPTFGGTGEGFGPPPGAEPWFEQWLSGFDSLLPAVQDIPAGTYWTARLSMNWELNPLRILGAVGAANLGIERQDLLLAAAEHATAERVIGAYHAIIMLAETANAVEAQHANQRELLNLARMRHELGFATRLDTLQAAVALGNLEPKLRRARRQVADAGARLNAVLGRDPAAPLVIANTATVELETIDRDRALELAVQRPELVAMDRLLGMLDRQRQAFTADARPYLTMHGSYGRVGTTLGTLGDDGHEVWLASVALNVPLFTGLFTKGRVVETRAQIRRTEAELSGYRRQAQVQVLALLNNLEAARQNLRAADLNLERAAEALAESMLMYEVGRTSYLTVLDAEANHLAARRILLEARYEVLTSTAALKRATGHSPTAPLTAIAGLTLPAASEGE
jgi:outer membrane protein TolC